MVLGPLFDLTSVKGSALVIQDEKDPPFHKRY